MWTGAVSRRQAPAAAASIAGVVAARKAGTLKSSDSVVAMVTGSGLKDTKSALRAGGSPIKIAPDLDELEQALARIAHKDRRES